MERTIIRKYSEEYGENNHQEIFRRIWRASLQIKLPFIQKYEDSPILGHATCLVHRACAGEITWEPTNCDNFIALKHDYDMLLSQLKKMLLRMNYNFKLKRLTKNTK